MGQMPGGKPSLNILDMKYLRWQATGFGAWGW
jgi:hypothetical protein